MVHILLDSQLGIINVFQIVWQNIHISIDICRTGSTSKSVKTSYDKTSTFCWTTGWTSWMCQKIMWQNVYISLDSRFVSKMCSEVMWQTSTFSLTAGWTSQMPKIMGQNDQISLDNCLVIIDVSGSYVTKYPQFLKQPAGHKKCVQKSCEKMSTFCWPIKSVNHFFDRFY